MNKILFRLNRLRQAIAASLVVGAIAGGGFFLHGAEPPESVLPAALRDALWFS